VFLVGIVFLAIHSSVEWLRLAVGCLQLLAGVIAARIVLRISASRPAAALTPAAFLLMPWAVREHGALLPEVVALPVMLGAALLAADRRRWAPAGVLCALLVLIKFPLAVPAVLVVLTAADVRRTAAAGTIALAAGLAACFAVAGGGFWHDTVVAQVDLGRESLHNVGGTWLQEAWNLVGLAFCAAVAVALRGLARDRRLLRISVALAAGNLITLLSNIKVGTSSNVTVTAEGALVPLAAVGVAFACRGAWRRRARWSYARTRWVVAACVVLAVFTLAQSVSLVADPAKPTVFARAGSVAYGTDLTAAQFDRAVAPARACPPDVASNEPPLVALQADRPLPDGQADQFLPLHSSALAGVEARIRAAGALCPAQSPAPNPT